MDNTDLQNALYDAIMQDPNKLFEGEVFAPFEQGRNGVWFSRTHVDGRRSKSGQGAYIDDGRKSGKGGVMLFDRNGAFKQGVFAYWKENGNDTSELCRLYNVPLPQEWQKELEETKKEKTATDKLLDDIRRDFLGIEGAPVREYLTRPIEQGGRGWNADTLSAMADYMGVVTDITARRLSDITGLKFADFVTATKYPIVLYTFTKRNGVLVLDYLKRRKNGECKDDKLKWGNVDAELSNGKGIADAAPFNYHNAHFLPDENWQTLVVVESEICAAHATVAGVKNVVAFGGSQGIPPKFITDKLSRTHCRNITFLYDTERDEKKKQQIFKKLVDALKVLQGAADGRFNIRVASIPTEYNTKDPDELLSRHPDDGRAMLQGIIDNATPSTEWMAKRYADKYNTATTDEERMGVNMEVAGVIVELKSVGTFGAMADADILKDKFCTTSGTAITAETFAQATATKAQAAKVEEYKKKRDKLQRELGNAIKDKNQRTIDDTLSQLNALKEPKHDPESDWTSKTYEDYAAELWRDESKDLETTYQVNVRRRNKQYQPQPIVLPANGITYIAGGTGHGKSTLLQNIAYDLMRGGNKMRFDEQQDKYKTIHKPKRVLYYGFEEEKRSTIFEFINIHIHAQSPNSTPNSVDLREVCELSSKGNNYAINAFLHTGDVNVFDGQKFHEQGDRGEYYDLTDKDKYAIGQAIKDFFKTFKGAGKDEDCKLFLYDDAFTSTELIEHINSVFPIYQPDVIFIDYMQFLEKDTATQQFEDLGRVSKDLIAINKKYNVPIVAAAQLKEKNNVKSSPDQLDYTDIFGASSIAQGAASVYVLGKSSRYKRIEGGETTLFQSEVRYCGNPYILGGSHPQMWVKCVKNRFGEDGGQAIYTFDGARRYIDPESIEKPENNGGEGMNNKPNMAGAR